MSWLTHPTARFLGVLIVIGFLSYFVLDPLFEMLFPVLPRYQHNARAALVVFGLSFTVFAVAAYRFIRRSPPLPPLSSVLNDEISGALGIFLGWLIGTTIFT
jgi:hypothetical protein